MEGTFLKEFIIRSSKCCCLLKNTPPSSPPIQFSAEVSKEKIKAGIMD